MTKLRSYMAGVAIGAGIFAGGYAFAAPPICQDTVQRFKDVAAQQHANLVEVTGEAAANVQRNFNAVPPASDEHMDRVFFVEGSKDSVILLWVTKGTCDPQGIPIPGKAEEKRLMQKNPLPFDPNQRGS